MDNPPAPYFEAQRRLDQPDWEVTVTWDHTLRQRIDGLVFRSKKDAEYWIAHKSDRCLELENVALAPRGISAGSRRLHPRASARERSSGVRNSAPAST
jgi:hypothetical protein